MSKGLDYFDLLVETQSDPLIDNDKLLEDFLTAWDKIGLNFDREEKEKYQIYEKEEKQTNLDEIIKNARESIKSIGKTIINHDNLDR